MLPRRHPVRIALRFALKHVAIGFGLSSLLVGALFWADPGGVGSLMRREASHPWPALLLWLFCGLSLSGVQLAVAIMLQDRPPDDDGPGGGSREFALVPLRVSADGR